MTTLSAFSATEDDLDRLLGQTAALLRERGQTRAAALLPATVLTFELDGGIFYPIEGDNWNENTYRAVLHVPRGSYDFDKYIRSAVWSVLASLLERFACREVQELVFREKLDPLPDVGPDWRSTGDRPRPTNQARRSRQKPGSDEHVHRNMVFDSRWEIAVFAMLERLQRDLNQTSTIAIAPLPAVQLRSVPTYLSPDVLVIGNGRAIVVEIDSPYHRSHRRRVDDDDRNRHWTRCGVRCLRVSVENIDDTPAEVEQVLREDLSRELGIPNPSVPIQDQADRAS